MTREGSLPSNVEWLTLTVGRVVVVGSIIRSDD